MNRKMYSLSCASLAFLFFVGSGVSIKAQSADSTANSPAPTANSTDTTPNSAAPAPKSADTTAAPANGADTFVIDTNALFKIDSSNKNLYDTNSSISNSYVDNSTSGYTGCGMTVPPAHAYGVYSSYGMLGGCGPSYGYGGCSSSRCGVGSWYNQSFGGYACGNVGYARSCGYRGTCGYRPAYNACCQGLSPVVTPSCCRPVANCCGAVSSNGVITQPVPVVPTPGTASPTPTNNTTPAPGAVDQVPSTDSPKPGA